MSFAVAVAMGGPGVDGAGRGGWVSPKQHRPTPDARGRGERTRSRVADTRPQARQCPVVRSVGFIVAGVAHMEWRRFIVYDVAGAVIWGIGHSVLGYALGASYQRWEPYVTPIGIGLLVVLLLLIGGSKLLAARRRVREELQAETGPEHDRDGG